MPIIHTTIDRSILLKHCFLHTRLKAYHNSIIIGHQRGNLNDVFNLLFQFLMDLFKIFSKYRNKSHTQYLSPYLMTNKIKKAVNERSIQ